MWDERRRCRRDFDPGGGHGVGAHAPGGRISDCAAHFGSPASSLTTALVMSSVSEDLVLPPKLDLYDFAASAQVVRASLMARRRRRWRFVRS